MQTAAGGKCLSFRDPLTFVSERAAVLCVVLHSGWKNSYKLTFAVLYREGTWIIARTRHRLGIERMIELLACHQSLVANEIVNATPTLQRLLRNLRCPFVPEYRHKGRHYPNRLLDELSHPFGIRRNPHDAPHAEHIACPGENHHPRQQ